MWPLAAPLEVHLVRPDAPAAAEPQSLAGSLRLGDVVAVLAPTRDGQPRVWIHRVVAIDAETVVLRGDTNARPDPPVPLRAVIGVVDAVRWGRVVVPWPCGQGASAQVWRDVGRGWSRIAPMAKRAWQRATRRASKT